MTNASVSRVSVVECFSYTGVKIMFRSANLVAADGPFPQQTFYSHNRRSTGVNNNINDGLTPFSCLNRQNVPFQPCLDRGSGSLDARLSQTPPATNNNKKAHAKTRVRFLLSTKQQTVKYWSLAYIFCIHMQLSVYTD